MSGASGPRNVPALVVGILILLTTGGCSAFMGLLAAYYRVTLIVVAIGGAAMVLGAGLIQLGAGSSGQPPTAWQGIVGWIHWATLGLLVALVPVGLVLDGLTGPESEVFWQASYVWNQLWPIALFAAAAYGMPLYFLGRALLGGKPAPRTVDP